MAKNPTNGDLLKEIKSMHNTLDHFDSRIDHLETWRITTDAASKAVDKYKHELERSREIRTKMDIFKALLPFIIALTALTYALITYLGKVKP